MYHQLSLFDTERTFVDNPIANFVRDGEVNISYDNWTMLKKCNTEEEIIDAFISEILSGNIDLPLRKITYDEMRESFLELMNYQCNDLQRGKTYTRYEYKYDMSDAYIDETNVGNIASDYFHQASRFNAGSINSPSPIRTWNSEKFLRGMLKALFTLKYEQINTASLRTCLHLRKYIASQFKPAVAKSVFEKFNSQYILDFSSGWGDRLCGFFATKGTKHYTGIDPNTALIEGYRNQTTAYCSMASGKSTSMICSPAEDVVLQKNSVDTVFTSPPYFNVERYCDEETQSFKRYKNLDVWLNGFLFRTLHQAWNALQKGGHMIINISDVYAGHRINHICDPMNEYIASLGGNYIGCIGMKMSKRPNSKSAGHENAVFVEPMWVWRKEGKFT